MALARREKVLKLYRQILQAGRTWQGSAEEKRYIFEEAKKTFRWNKSVEDKTRIDYLIREGFGRLEYAIHYNIPYPRLEHASQFHKQYFLRAPKKDPAGPDQPSGDTSSNSKLAAAAERVKRKHECRSGSPE